jgi:multisubunit Na+/H+ antiporter MnhF subunit
MNPLATQPSGPRDDAWLDQMIRAQPPPYLADDGFTARVMVALPLSRRRSERTRAALVIGAAAIGCSLAGVLAGPAFPDRCVALASQFAATATLPIPGTGATLTVGSAFAILAIASAGWWALARSK